ncbi:unnamed protein product [Durusdinium trenchii]|uniref:1-alkyl-2-acetylglycerophosphocholine esterase n=1 Tax=Durusdinium trenchii TaxID=1381693 RepID=A0ABP0S3E2_9DINO
MALLGHHLLEHIDGDAGGLVLCGHSYGTSVAWTMAEGLLRMGLGPLVKGLVDLDPRWFLVRAAEVPCVPRALAHSLGRVHFHLPLEQFTFVVPTVPLAE